MNYRTSCLLHPAVCQTESPNFTGRSLKPLETPFLYPLVAFYSCSCCSYSTTGGQVLKALACTYVFKLFAYALG